MLLTVESVEVDNIELGVLLHEEQHHMRGAEKGQPLEKKIESIKQQYMNPAPPVINMFRGT